MALRWSLVVLWSVVGGFAILAAEEPAATEGNQATAEDSLPSLVNRLKPSLVTIRSTDRDGDELGLGTGFIIDAAGLIATNLHVISEGRPIQVDLANKVSLEVIAIEASSRKHDLAILRVKPPKLPLPALTLSSGPAIEQGTPVLALGNPLGLRQSVVQGVVSALREIDQQELIQIAIPIEPGNSGGPLVDLQGKVHGIINMKSAVARNVGFAIPVASLQALLEAPNPIPMERWVRLSGVDPRRWETVMGGDWRERSSILRVSSSGQGFGGRALCLSEQPVPEPRMHLGVEVRLGDESGAAGLVFHADGGDRHYGFYPSNGKLRLTCFRGPNVMNWEVVREIYSADYRPGQWNRLKVEVDGDLIRCYVNHRLVIEQRHRGLKRGRVGVAAFRGTEAEFRRFEVAETLADRQLSPPSEALIEKASDPLLYGEHLDLTKFPEIAAQSEPLAMALEREADRFEKKAAMLRRLAEDAQLAPIIQRLGGLLEQQEPTDLLEGALLIAALDHPELDLPAYLQRIEDMAAEILAKLPSKATAPMRLEALDAYLFEENGFRGGRDEYYHPANNHLDRVIDDREGMPITLSVLYMELGRRLQLRLEGVGLPGHFVVRFRPSQGKPQLLDVFDKAKVLSDTDVAMMVMMNSQRLTTEEDLRTQTTLEILTRMLRNLVTSAQQNQDQSALYRYSEGLAALHPEGPEYRWLRTLARYRTERWEAAFADAEWLVEQQPEGLDQEQLLGLREELANRLDQAAR